MNEGQKSNNQSTTNKLATEVANTVGEKVSEIMTKFLDDSAASLLTPFPYDDQVLRDAVLDPLNTITSGVQELKNNYAVLRTEMQQHGAIISFLAQTQNEFLTSTAQKLIPSGRFLARYQEHGVEKRNLSAFVAWKWFPPQLSPARYFVQASSTALHLGYALSAAPMISEDCLLYTNSAVMPLAALWGSQTRKYTVMTFCGYDFDHDCGGWVIPLNDQESSNSLRKLFKREKDPLTTAFVMPMLLAVDSGLYYQRRDVAQFTDTLGNADNVVILLPGNRLIASIRGIDNDERQLCPALSQLWKNPLGRVTVVVSRPHEPLHAMAAQIQSQGINVYWQSCDGWYELQSTNNETKRMWG